MNKQQCERLLSVQASEDKTEGKKRGREVKKRARCDTDEPATKSLTLRVNMYVPVYVFVCIKHEGGGWVGGDGSSVAD